MNECYITPRRRHFIIPVLLLFLLNPLLGQSSDSAGLQGKIRIASCQFPVSDQIGDNARWIMDQMSAAHDSGAQVAHFPECALSGYPGVDLMTMEDFEWGVLYLYTDSIMRLADELDMWVILGSIHALGAGYRPMNSLYVIDPAGRIIERYDKRFCTGGDLKFFSAGDHFSTFEINGIKCGLLICFDVRFPELYREYRKLEVELIFQSFYNARQKPGGIHPKIMPLTAQARAATNHFYMSLTNSSAPSSWPCHFITPDGLLQGKLEPDRAGILISEADLTKTYYDASGQFRKEAMNGKLSSGSTPDHPRNTNRTIL